jgi:DNA-binding Lrp family transcriptional regulator
MEVKGMPVFFIAKSELGEVKKVADALAKIDEVSEVYMITGEFDILARLNVKPGEAIDLVVEKLLKIEGIKETRTIIGKKVQ